MAGLFEEPHASSSKDQVQSQSTSAKLPKGVVLDKDGKPCRTCTSTSAWLSMMKNSNKPTSRGNSTAAFASAAGAATAAAAAATTSTSDTTTSPTAPRSDCPPDVDELGRSTWTFLHTLTATYPEDPTPSMQSTTRQFISLFSQLYPCWVCADDFRGWLAKPENEPQLKNQDEFGRWMCKAHNEVNKKLGKREFDCDLWKERWRDGWKDGRCD